MWNKKVLTWLLYMDSTSEWTRHKCALSPVLLSLDVSDWKGTVCNLVLVRYWVFLQFQFSLTPPSTKILYLIKCRCCWQVVSEQFPHLQSQATWCLFGPGLCISLTCSTVTTYLCCFVKGWKEKIEKWKITHHSEWCVRRTTLIFS